MREQLSFGTIVTSVSRRGIGLLLVTALALTGCSGGSESSGASSDGGIRVTARDNSFDPSVLDLKAGDEVTIEVVNEGNVPHDFSIATLDVETDIIRAGDTRLQRSKCPRARRSSCARFTPR